VEPARRPAERLIGPDPGVLHRREGAGVNGLGNQRARHAEVEGQLAHPFSRPLGPGRIEDQVDQVLTGLVVLDAEDVARDLDQVAVQLPLIPLGEHLVKLLVR